MSSDIKIPDKLIGFTQSSYPAFSVFPASDEDYKTLLSVMSLQRWAKISAYSNIHGKILKEFSTFAAIMNSLSEFEMNFRCYYRPLTMYALRYTENIDDAEDIVQEAFVDTWHKLSGGNIIRNLKAYLYQTVRNGCLDYRKMPGKEEMQEDCAEPEMNGEERIIRSERDAQIWTAIDGLPKERKRIFLLAKRDGLTYQEIADELGLSVKTVEHQISAALKTLRRIAVKIYLFFFS